MILKRGKSVAFLESIKVESKPDGCNAIDTHCKALMDNETSAKKAAGWHWDIAYY